MECDIRCDAERDTRCDTQRGAKCGRGYGACCGTGGGTGCDTKRDRGHMKDRYNKAATEATGSGRGSAIGRDVEAATWRATRGGKVLPLALNVTRREILEGSPGIAMGSLVQNFNIRAINAALRGSF